MDEKVVEAMKVIREFCGKQGECFECELSYARNGDCEIQREAPCFWKIKGEESENSGQIFTMEGKE